MGKKYDDIFETKKYHIFTDGSFSRGKMGAAWIVATSNDDVYIEGVEKVSRSDAKKGSSKMAEIIACTNGLREFSRQTAGRTEQPHIIIYTDCEELKEEIDTDRCKSAIEWEDDPGVKNSYRELREILSSLEGYKLQVRHTWEHEYAEMSRVDKLARFATKKAPKRRMIEHITDMRSREYDTTQPEIEVL